MHCPSCGELSLNVVSEAHLDVPFYHDRVVRLIDRPFVDSRDLTVDDFHERLWSAGFDAERAKLASCSRLGASWCAQGAAAARRWSPITTTWSRPRRLAS